MAKHPTIAELEERLKGAERRIAELSRERDEARALVRRVEERLADNGDMIERWIEAFEMELRDDGTWVWKESFVAGAQWFERHQALLRKWNTFVARYNAVVDPRDIGRPLGATDEQAKAVRKLHARGMSLRKIADEIGIGLQTVRTIVGRETFTDRTSMKRLERIDPDRPSVVAWKSRKRTRDALPRQINEALAHAKELAKEVKGLGC